MKTLKYIQQLEKSITSLWIVVVNEAIAISLIVVYILITM